ncbi:MAG: hypothetical protein R3A78_07795 [Polyangiales bacterium]|nr:hypothetical protein [Myxococcales bacterium]
MRRKGVPGFGVIFLALGLAGCADAVPPPAPGFEARGVDGSITTDNAYSEALNDEGRRIPDEALGNDEGASEGTGGGLPGLDAGPLGPDAGMDEELPPPDGGGTDEGTGEPWRDAGGEPDLDAGTPVDPQPGSDGGTAPDGGSADAGSGDAGPRDGGRTDGGAACTDFWGCSPN